MRLPSVRSFITHDPPLIFVSKVKRRAYAYAYPDLPSTTRNSPLTPHLRDTAEEDDDDNMEEIDTGNIINDGRRTRGKTIDFAKAAENAGDDLDDDDDEEDDDFEEKEDDAMHE